MNKKWKWISILSSVALTAALAGVWLFGSTTVASASEMTAKDVKTLTQSTTGPGLLGEGYLAHGGWGRDGKGAIDAQRLLGQQLLADALGITVEQLQEAYEAARTAAIEQAVERGLITREQADQALVWGGIGGKWFGGMRGFDGFLGRGRAPKGISSAEIDENALLAEALGITPDELQAAREQANRAALQQAVEEGLITQEQADQMLEQKQTHEALQSYISPDLLLSQALGMTVEELQSAYQEGKSLSDLLSEKGLVAATVRDKMQAAFEAGLAKAVTDSVLSQEQADELANRGFMVRGFGGRPGLPGHEGMPGKEGFRGRGGFGERHPRNPDSDGTDDGTSGTRFRRPGPNSESSAL